MQQYGTPLSAAFSPSPFLRRPGDPPIKMGFLAATINLAKVMAGAGMLSLPSGMAAGRGTGYAASALALAAAAAAGGYTFFSLGVCLRYTRTASFKDLLIVTLGPWSGWCIDVIIVALGFSLGLLYVDFVGDLFSSVLASFSWIPDWVASRDVVIIVASICFLGPLSLAKDLYALRHSSYVGMFACLYIAAFLSLRALDGSYAPGGAYYQGGEEKDTETTDASTDNGIGLWGVGPGSAIFLSMLALSFCAHQNTPQFASQLEKFSYTRFAQVTAAGYGLTLALYAAVLFAGAATFGAAADGDVLQNFSPQDPLATGAQISTGLSVLGSFPFIFATLRESLGNLMAGSCGLKPSFNVISLSMLAAIVLMSFVATQVSFIVSMTGCLCDFPIMFLVPPAVYFRVRATLPAASSVPVPRLLRSRGHAALQALLFAVGTVFTAVTPVLSVLNTFTDVLQRH